MDSLFIAVELSPLSVWAREDAYAYFASLIGHAIGMALLVGGGIAVSLCRLGVLPADQLPALRGFLRVMGVGAVLATLSGLVLLVAYPAKALTNPVFALKFACLVTAAVLLRVPGRGAAAGGLLLWLGGVAAGKLLLHTATVLTVS